MSLGLYLHIPYCFSKCRYCDFYSHPGERGVPDAYVDALLRELHRFAPDAPLRPDTLYFGGGTPSLLRQSGSSGQQSLCPVQRSPWRQTPRLSPRRVCGASGQQG